MANEKSTAPGAARCLTTWDDDEREESAVLRQVLEYHPATLTQDELIREMTGGGSTAFTDADAIERALRELAGAGLLHRPGEDAMLRPTRAAVRYSELTRGARGAPRLASSIFGDQAVLAAWVWSEAVSV